MFRIRRALRRSSPRRRWRLAAPLTLVVVLAGILPALSAPAAHAIAGGMTVTNRDLAYVAEIRNTAVSSGPCTGSLIHPSWVLTAIHCSVPTSVGDMTARIGNRAASSGGEIRRIKRILRKPSYSGGFDDVALLELSSPVSNVTPVQLATPSMAPLWDGVAGGIFGSSDSGIATGWGVTSSGSLATALQFVGVRITPPSWDAAGNKIVKVERGPCAGDSGGPLLVSSGGADVQAGVVKAADANCGGVGEYSEVGAGRNRDWILNQMTRLPYTPSGIADFDGDGHQDLVIRQDATGQGWLYPGESTRTYSSIPRVEIGNGWNGYTSVGIADWDHDGHQDLLFVYDATGELWLYPGDSNRGYSSIQRVKIGGNMKGRTVFGVADWDRDGHQDLVFRQDTTGDLFLWRGSSRRTPSTATPLRIGWGTNSYSSFGVADWDDDGHQDLILRQNDSGDLWLYPGESKRVISSTQRVKIGNGYNGHTAFGVADWDRDGHQDLMVRHDASGRLWLQPGQSRRGYSAIAPVQVGSGV